MLGRGRRRARGGGGATHTERVGERGKCSKNVQKGGEKEEADYFDWLSYAGESNETGERDQAESLDDGERERRSQWPPCEWCC
jgi:hypothetical protein